MLYISPSLVGQMAADNTACMARIGYRTITESALITATSQTSGFPASAVANSMTYERWMPSAAPATLNIDAGGLLC